MTVLCTHPGKYGDLLWGLPTVRAISRTVGEPVDLILSERYGDIAVLLERQPYVRQVIVDPNWDVRDTAPMTPCRPEHPVSLQMCQKYDRVVHLGYERWPMNTLPVEQYLQAVGQWGEELQGWSLVEAWVEAPDDDDDPEVWGSEFYAGWGVDQRPAVHVGFTDEWAELKMGVLYALTAQCGHDLRVVTTPGSRLEQEWLRHYPGEEGSEIEEFENLSWCSGGWRLCAHAIAHSSIFLGDCSAQHVLACALGKPVVIMEPNPHRHNAIFYPYGMDGSGVTVVKGIDGKPTFDARHVVEAVKAALEEL